MGKKHHSKYNHVSIALNDERNNIHNLINDRVDLMLKNGLLEEVEKLHKYSHLNTLNTVGYKELFNYLDGKVSKVDAVEHVKRNTEGLQKNKLLG